MDEEECNQRQEMKWITQKKEKEEEKKFWQKQQKNESS